MGENDPFGRIGSGITLGLAKRINRTIALAVLLSLSGVIVVAWVIYAEIKSQIVEEVGKSLQTTLDTSRDAVGRWSDLQLRWAMEIANHADIVRLLNALIAPISAGSEQAKTPDQIFLENIISHQMTLVGFKNFVIMSENGDIISASHPAILASQEKWIDDKEFVDTVFSGTTHLTAPMKSKIPLMGRDGVVQNDLPVIFVGAPIKGLSDNQKAAIFFQIDPAEDFTRILQRGRIGESGETYALDFQGRLLSESRFDVHLRAAGLIGETQKGILNIEVRDPGFEITKDRQPHRRFEDLPLTLMANSIASRQSGLQLEPYRDYRGVKVIGAWSMDDSGLFGLATEQDATEALATVKTLQYGFLLFILVITATTIALAGFYGRSRSQRLQEERRLQNLLETSPVGVSIVLPQTSTRLFANQRYNDMFGVTPGHSNDDTDLGSTFVNAHDADGIREAIKQNNGRFETDALRRRLDGTEFWCLQMGRPADFWAKGAIMVWHWDITDYKNAQQILQDNERQFVQILEDSPVAVGISIDDKTDDDGLIVYANNKFAEYVGISRDQLGEARTNEFFRDRPERERHEAELDRGNSLQNMEQRIIVQGEADLWVLMSIVPIEYNNRRSALIWLYDISKQKRTEESFRLDSETFAAMFDESPMPMLVRPKDQLKYLRVNQAACEIFGLSEPELLALDPLDIWYEPGEREQFLATVREPGTSAEVRINHFSSGGYRDALTRTSTIIFEGVPALLMTAIDITDRKIAEEIVADREGLLRTILDNMPGAMWLVDKDQNLVFANDQYVDFYGDAKGLVKPGTPIAEILRQEAEARLLGGEGNADEIVEERIASYRGNEISRFEDRTIDGRDIRVIRRPTSDGSVVSVATDVTEGVQALRNRGLLAEALNTFTDMVILYDKHERVIFSNNRYHEIYPNSPGQEEIRNHTMESLLRRSLETGQISNPLAKSDPEAWIQKALESRRNPEGGSGETAHSSGRTFFYRYERTTEGGLILLQTDISERKVMEEALRESEQSLAETLDASPIGVSIVGEDGKSKFVNRRISEMLGVPQNELLAQHVQLYYAQPTIRDELIGKLRENGSVVDTEVQLTRGDGTFIWVLMTMMPTKFEDQPAVMAWMYDITERKAFEDKLADGATLIRSVLDNINQGLIAFDDQRGLQAWNNRTKEIMDFPDNYLQIGVSAIEIARHIVNQGAYDSGHIDERVESFWSGEVITRATLKLANGKSYDSIAHRTPENWVVITYTDTTEREKSEQQVRKILEDLPGGITVAGIATSDLVFANAHFRKIFKIDESDVRSANIGGLYANPEDRANIRGELIDGGTVRDREVMLRRSDGSEFWGQVTVLPFEYEGQPATLGGYNDITDQKEAEAEIMQARDAAEAAAKAKASFLAAMSHEIRTPMNGVVGMVDLLQQTAMNDDQRQMLGTVRDSGHSLLTIINDILDFSKIEAGKLELEEIPISLTDVVEGSLQTIAPNAVKKGLRLVSYVDPNIPPFVLGDSVRIRQVLINLGGNAIKFSDAGEVVVRAELRDGSGDGVHVRFGIVDNGIGISEEAQKTLFQEFSQADTSTTRKFGGTGLGLSISQRLTEMMGGEIGVVSTLGEGSEFFADIIFAPSDKQIQSDAGDDLKGLSVMVINPIEEERLIWQRYLEHWYAEVSGLGSLAEFTKHLAADPTDDLPYDIVVVEGDHDIEGVTDMRRQAIDSGRMPYPRFVISQDPRDGKDAFKDLEEVTLVDSNPVRRAALLSAVAIAAGRASPEVSYEDEVEDLRAGRAPTVDEARAQGKLILLAEDNLTNQDVIRRQLTMLGYACEIASDGAEGRDMWKSTDYALLLTDCHMPEMDGFELTAAIRETEESTDRRSPIIAITANALQGESERCIAAGMDDYLSKPVDMKILKTTLQKWMGDGGQADDNDEIVREHSGVTREVDGLSSPGNSLAQGTKVDTPIDENALKSVFGDDQATFIEILKDFVEPATDNVSEIKAAFNERSSDGVAKAAHKLKSSSRSVGAIGLAEICQTLEAAGNANNWEEVDEAVPLLPGALKTVVAYIDKL